MGIRVISLYWSSSLRSAAMIVVVLFFEIRYPILLNRHILCALQSSSVYVPEKKRASCHWILTISFVIFLHKPWYNNCIKVDGQKRPPLTSTLYFTGFLDAFNHCLVPCFCLVPCRVPVHFLIEWATKNHCLEKEWGTTSERMVQPKKHLFKRWF